LRNIPLTCISSIIVTPPTPLFNQSDINKRHIFSNPRHTYNKTSLYINKITANLYKSQTTHIRYFFFHTDDSLPLNGDILITDIRITINKNSDGSITATNQSKLYTTRCYMRYDITTVKYESFHH